jgi:pimeloyl-ACP methyl ester carboxylesterase
LAKIEQTHINIAQPVLDRIARRVADAEIGYAPDDDEGWKYGVDARWLADLRTYWRDEYDWRKAESAFNAHPQFRTEIDGISIHFFHFRAKTGDGYPLLLTHGWPGSVLEFMEAAPLLAAQGYDVVVPSLPGYGFSGRPPRPIGPARVAALWRKLMVDGLGYARFGAQGGDWGSTITRALGAQHGDVVGAIHLNMLALSPEAEATPEVIAWRQKLGALLMNEGAYAAEQASKPQTIGLALADTPLGFAGWVAEKCRSWSDCNGALESVFSKDALLTNAMTYLATGNVQAAIWMYRTTRAEPFAPGPVSRPVGFAEFPAEFLPPPPRQAVEQGLNIVHWTKMEKGGHFAAWEQPAAFAHEVGTFFRDFR